MQSKVRFSTPTLKMHTNTDYFVKNLIKKCKAKFNFLPQHRKRIQTQIKFVNAFIERKTVQMVPYVNLTY